MNNFSALILDLLEWIVAENRTMPELLGHWDTLYPGLGLWDEAHGHGLVRSGMIVELTDSGRAFLMYDRGTD